ncbi:PREDICTED: putative G3BP-like protein [Tarenaya hassleriana]|uniref:putative G3BP-like protein n=1 Tax=Tarenaya hassleriana TaxID=28532 RepID=UPI00053C6817|nr:PREDICTED: putative G3BP-like protein [Tarenaya hassleriana]
MASEEGNHPANEVSDAFVKQYFHILEQLPEEARRLYVSDSVVSRPGPDGTMMSFTSLEAINEQILSCDYKNATFEVVSVDSQNSSESGIFIMVIGFVTGKDKLRKKFSQSFYLARQNNVYVVLNDILRYVGEDEASAPAQAALSFPESMPVNEMAKSAEEINQTNPIQESDASVENSENAAEITPLENGTVEKSDGKAVTAEKQTEPVAEAVAPKAEQSDAAKRSFAAIVQSMARNAAPFKSPVQKPKPVRQTRAAAVPQSSGSVMNSEKKNDQKIIEEPGTSIFVANLPMNAMPADLHGMFKDFGPIKENGIQVRSSRSSGICFGFVAFESASSVQSVLQAAKDSPFVLGDRKLRVKEKQVDYEGSKPSGRNGGASKNQNGSANGGDRENSGRSRRNGGRNGAERRGDGSHQKAKPEGGEGAAVTSSQSQD